MLSNSLWWLTLNFISIIVLAFYSMIEMACVSFNKVRLQYYVSQNNKRAIWLNSLLHNSAKLFGTTLIGVNIALVIGSECAREFHMSLGIDPDFAPFTQVFLVVVFGELAPMFAARHYAENVAMLGAPIIYFSAKILSPFLWLISLMTETLNKFIKGSSGEPNIYLSREEILKILEEQEEDVVKQNESDEFNAVSTNIFSLNAKDANQIMHPLHLVKKIPSNTSVKEMRSILQRSKADYLLIYHKNPKEIIGIAFPRDLIKAADNKRVRDFARAPWFVTQHTKLMQILKQFKSNQQSIAVILDTKGNAIGIIDLYDIMEEIFGKTVKKATDTITRFPKKVLINKTFPGDMLVKEFNREYEVVLSNNEDLTLSQLVAEILGHHPSVGDSIFIEPFELTVKETFLLDVKTINITTFFG
ncbi:MAG: hypothetical protein BGO10_08980 [Chlamydia sp. 32-24]|nr:MAG: hypothetical protein BGO10_08980 [Chlamydia sp. 32-24]